MSLVEILIFKSTLCSGKLGNEIGRAVQATLGAGQIYTENKKSSVSFSPLFFSYFISNLAVDSVSLSFKIDSNSGDLPHFLYLSHHKDKM